MLLHCGGWRCIHNWEPDPFATSASEGRVVKLGDATLHGSPEAVRRFEKAESAMHFRQLADPVALVDQARASPFKSAQLQRKMRKHLELQDLTDAELQRFVDRIRSKPDEVYYRFLDGRSVINFVKDGWLCGAAGDEIKTLFKIWNLDQYRVDQMQYWIKLDR